jgi:hypothetical protein
LIEDGGPSGLANPAGNEKGFETLFFRLWRGGGAGCILHGPGYGDAGKLVGSEAERKVHAVDQ